MDHSYDVSYKSVRRQMTIVNQSTNPSLCLNRNTWVNSNSCIFNNNSTRLYRPI